MSDTNRMAEWTISVMVGGEWYPAPRFVVAGTETEAMDLAGKLYPGRKVCVRKL